MQQQSYLHYHLKSHSCIGRGEKGSPATSKLKIELEFGGEWAKTKSGSEFLVGSQNDIHMFATEDNLNISAEADKL